MRSLKAGARVIAVLVFAAGAAGLGCATLGPTNLGTCYGLNGEFQNGTTEYECTNDCPNCSWSPDRGPE
jgi:hypothetical protein